MHVHRRFLTPAFVVIGLLLVGGCGSSSTQTAPPTPVPTPVEPSIAIPSEIAAGMGLPSFGLSGGPDPSTIVSTDMAASVIGGTPQKVTLPSMPQAIGNLVSYANANGDTLTVLVEKLPGTIPAAALEAAITAEGAQGSFEAVSGIGDIAGKTVSSTDATIAFAKGSLIVVVSATSGSASGAQLEPKVESLVREISGKL